MNKYEKWYAAITKRGQNRYIDDYTEIHHIIPQSLGGPDTFENRTILTAREHFICHWLLIKIYATGDEHWKMLNAIRIMRAENKNQKRYSTKITSRVYENLKKEYSKLQSEKVRGENNGFYGKTHTYESKAKISAANLGENNGSKTKEARIKISESKLGKKRSPFNDQWIEKMSIKKRGENNPRYGVILTDDVRKKISYKMKGRKQSPETVAKKIAASTGTKREKKLCPHCNKLVAVNGYARWHGDNCKEKV